MERAGFEIEAQPLCRHHQLGVIPYSPMAGGFLTGKYRRGVPPPAGARAKAVSETYLNERGWAVIDALAAIGRTHSKTTGQTALAWLLSNPVVTAPIVGANRADQLRESLGAAGYRLDAGEMARLNELTNYPKNWRPVWD
jgi:aryl-alcohol dehydrogenase-like predicted oxidoreductase